MRVLIGAIVGVAVTVVAAANCAWQSCSCSSVSHGETRSIRGGQSCPRCCYMKDLEHCPEGTSTHCGSAQCHEVNPESPWQCEPEYVGFIYEPGNWASCASNWSVGRYCNVRESVVCQARLYCLDDCEEFGTGWTCVNDLPSLWVFEQHDDEELVGEQHYCA
jgi:hypothetical protein